MIRIEKPNFTIHPIASGLDDIYKSIELAGRTCYKSFDKITPDSARKFVDRMISSGHGAMLEHGTVYLMGGSNSYLKTTKYVTNKYSKVQTACNVWMEGSMYYITTNLRVLVENSWMDDLKYLCKPSDYHQKRITVSFNTDRITGESFLRHRSIDEDHPELHFAVTKEMEKDIDSFARESTRFCNYSKDKFDGHLTFIKPHWLDIATTGDLYNWTNNECIIDDKSVNLFDDEKHPEYYDIFQLMEQSQSTYMKFISLGYRPEDARSCLLFPIKSPLVMTAFVDDWEHFFDLRCAKSAHPDAQFLSNGIREEFIKLGFL